METIELKAETRPTRGKCGARTVRRSGKIPAILYGPKRDPLALSIDAKAFVTRIASVEGSHLIRWDSSLPDVAGRLAVVKEIQHHPVSGEVLHADLYEVDENTAIDVMVPLHFIGRAAGVDMGGILQPIVREIEVSCLPHQIPDYLEVDVTHLGIHEAIHGNEIALPPGVKLASPSKAPIVTVLPPTVEEVKTQAPEAAAAVEGAASAAPAAGGAPAAPAKTPASKPAS